MAFEYDVNQEVDFIFDEKPGNSFLAMRKVRWGNSGEYKLELRKWFLKADGTETPGKGFTFMSDNGPDNLAEVLVGQGYGNTKKLRDLIDSRPDKEEDNTILFDPKECIG